MPAPQLSVVIPAFNEEIRIGPTVERVLEYCDAEFPVAFELVVVLRRKVAADQPQLVGWLRLKLIGPAYGQHLSVYFHSILLAWAI